MSIVNGWVSWATKVPNPHQWKVYPGVNPGSHGTFCHSVEGELTKYGLNYIPRAFDPDEDLSNMFTLLYGGLSQHFPVTAKCWCSGDADANSLTWNVEAEGYAGTPLNDYQVDAMLRLTGEWETYTGKKASRGSGPLKWFPWGSEPYPADRTLWEHNEAVATACPSNRYDEFFAIIATGGTGMSSAEYKELKALYDEHERRLDQILQGGWTSQSRLDHLTGSGGFASLDQRIVNLEGKEPIANVREDVDALERQVNLLDARVDAIEEGGADGGIPYGAPVTILPSDVIPPGARLAAAAEGIDPSGRLKAERAARAAATEE